MNKWLAAVLLVVVVAGCGIEWFPEDKASGSRNNVSFSAVQNKCGKTPSSPVTSDPIQVFGLVTSASISVTGDAGRFSKYSLNDAEFTDAADTIKKGTNPVSVRLQHLAAAENATSKIVITKLTVAGKDYFFKSSTDPCIGTGTQRIQAGRDSNRLIGPGRRSRQATAKRRNKNGNNR